MSKPDIDFEKDLWKAVDEMNNPDENNPQPKNENSLLEEGGSKSREVYHDTSGFCKVAILEEVIAQDYKFTPGIHIGTEDDDGVPFEEKMEGLKDQLTQQFEKSNKLQGRIKTNLNRV